MQNQRCFVFQAGCLNLIWNFAECVFNKCSLLLNIWTRRPIAQYPQDVVGVRAFVCYAHSKLSDLIERFRSAVAVNSGITLLEGNQSASTTQFRLSIAVSSTVGRFLADVFVNDTLKAECQIISSIHRAALR